MNKDSAILIAEQDEKHFDIMKHSLLRAGVGNQILHFADGRRTLDFLFALARQPDDQRKNKQYILFLDVNLPEVSGVEVLREIKADEKLSKIPVIVFTEQDDPQTIDRCYDLGCSTYIVKPGEKEGLDECVKKIGYFLSVIEITSVK